MTPKQGERENTGGKRIKKVRWSKGGRKKKRKGGRGEKIELLLFLLLYSLFRFFSVLFFFFFLKNLTPDIPRSIHFGSPRTMKKFSCLSYSSSSTILTLTVFLQGQQERKCRLGRQVGWSPGAQPLKSFPITLGTCSPPWWLLTGLGGLYCSQVKNGFSQLFLSPWSELSLQVRGKGSQKARESGQRKGSMRMGGKWEGRRG